MTVAEENVSKSMVFWAFFAHFQSDLFPKGSNVIVMVCIGYEQVPPTVKSIFRVVSRGFCHILGHFMAKFAKNGRKRAKIFFLKFTPNDFLVVFRCKMGLFWLLFMERGLEEVVVA